MKPHIYRTHTNVGAQWGCQTAPSPCLGSGLGPTPKKAFEEWLQAMRWRDCKCSYCQSMGVAAHPWIQEGERVVTVMELLVKLHEFPLSATVLKHEDYGDGRPANSAPRPHWDGRAVVL